MSLLLLMLLFSDDVVVDVSVAADVAVTLTADVAIAVVVDIAVAVAVTVATAVVVSVAADIHADVAVAVTGVAGPDGGSIEKPVGTVFVSWASRSGALRTERFLFEGDRVAVRAQTVIEALGGLIRFMHDESD